MLTNELHKNMLNSPVRTIQGRVEVLRDSTQTYVMDSDDALKSITVERLGDNSKFFGYGVMHKMNFKALDVNREIDVHANDKAVPYFGVEESYYAPFVPMYVTEVHRDENTNALSITAYDKLYNSSTKTLLDVNLEAPYTISDLVYACAEVLGVGVAGDCSTGPFGWDYEIGANYVGDESILDVLVDIAEVTNTIYYLDRDEKLNFKMLDIDGPAVTTLTKEDYITLSSKTNRRLTNIAHVTELGEDFTSGMGISGSTQYIRDNPFLDMLDGTTVAERVNAMVERICGLTINQFNCQWRGNYLIEIGDKIGLITKDGESTTSYLLNDTIEYDGALSQKTLWEFEDKNEAETAEHPITITERLNQTYAKVDKINNRIDLVASKVEENSEEIAQIVLNSDKISVSVTELRKTMDAEHDIIEEEIETLRKTVDMTMTSEEVSIAIKKELENGVDKVTTSTGYTFNEEGLHIEKSGSQMSTTVSEDGMVVYRDGDEVLVANNEGVKAEDLHATTYLIIGKNSRFEDYKDGYQERTGCFWIGG